MRSVSNSTQFCKIARKKNRICSHATNEFAGMMIVLGLVLDLGHAISTSLAELNTEIVV